MNPTLNMAVNLDVDVNEDGRRYGIDMYIDTDSDINMDNVMGPEPQRAKTFGWSWSHNKV
jgi:hypothetical protein